MAKKNKEIAIMKTLMKKPDLTEMQDQGYKMFRFYWIYPGTNVEESTMFH
jgi:hypothetical protein